MRLVFSALLISIISIPTLHAETYSIDSEHSQVAFNVRHLVSRANGVFNEFSGQIQFDPAQPEKIQVEATIAVSSVDTDNEKRDEHLRSVLEEVRLGALVQRYPDFNIKQDWPRLLSLGEQQRLAFARLLLNSPRFVVLDEATSALDVATEQHLYDLLTQREMAFVSVGHRPTLRSFHNLVLELDGQGGWKLMPAASYTFNSGV